MEQSAGLSVGNPYFGLSDQWPSCWLLELFEVVLDLGRSMKGTELALLYCDTVFEIWGGGELRGGGS